MSVEASEKIAARAIIKIGNKVLLGKRGRGIAVGQYELVGGKSKIYESPEQAVRREISEEVGVELQNLIFWKEETNDDTKPGENWQSFYFIGEIKGRLLLKKDEVSEVILVDRHNLKDIEIAFNHRKILEEYFGLR